MLFCPFFDFYKIDGSKFIYFPARHAVFQKNNRSLFFLDVVGVCGRGNFFAGHHFYGHQSAAKIPALFGGSCYWLHRRNPDAAGRDDSFLLKPDEIDGKVPEIGVTAYGSSRGQFQFTLEPYFYFCRDKISLWFDLEYQDWFASYFGRGNSPDIDEFTNYNRKKLYFGAKVESRLGLPDYLKYGLELHIESSEIDFKRAAPRRFRIRIREIAMAWATC